MLGRLRCCVSVLAAAHSQPTGGKRWGMGGPVVGCLAVGKSRRAGGMQAAHAGGQVRAYHACQYVTCSGRGQSGAATVVNAGQLPWCRNNAARAFENDGALEPVGQLLCRVQPVGLHLGHCATQQARSFQRVRGDVARAAALAVLLWPRPACLARRLQRLRRRSCLCGWRAGAGPGLRGLRLAARQWGR